MAKKALFALAGGLGSVASVALLSFLTRSLNVRGNYLLGALSAVVAFAPIGISVVGSVYLASPALQQMTTKVLVAIAISLCLAGALFPLGIIGFYLGFVVLAISISMAIHGASMVAAKSVLWSLGGFLLGGVASILWGGFIMMFWKSSLPNSEPLVVWIPAGLISYGFTLGLLFSLPEQ